MSWGGRSSKLVNLFETDGWFIDSLGWGVLLWFVDPRGSWEWWRCRRFVDEPFRVGLVGGVEDSSSLHLDGFGPAVVDVGGGVVSDTGVAVFADLEGSDRQPDSAELTSQRRSDPDPQLLRFTRAWPLDVAEGKTIDPAAARPKTPETTIVTSRVASFEHVGVRVFD